MELEKRLFHRRNPICYAPRRERTFPGWFAPYLSHRRVNDRQRRFHSEPRRVAGKPTVQSNRNAFAFPTPPQNGHLVSRSNASDRHGDGSQPNHGLPRDGRRLQSLPPAKPKMDEFDSRQVRSAPNAEGEMNHMTVPNGFKAAEPRPGPQPRSRISDNETSKELPQRTHGKATRSYEERYLRSNKFASSWAQVRADNPAFNDLSPDGSPIARKFRPKDQSPDSSTKLNSTRDSSPSAHDEFKKEHKKPVTKQNRGRTHNKTRAKTKLKFADENNNGESPGRVSHGEESDTEKGSPNSEQRERKVSRKKGWVDSVVVPPYEKPPPKYVSLRYVDNLTFKPTINTGSDVLKTYVVKDKKLVRENTGDLNTSASENEEGYDSPVNGSTYSQDESEENSQERKKKEPFLNRREAIKYIKMNNVYGSDAYKNQRKEWFVQKFSEVQETKAKYDAEQRREERRRRQEYMKKQKQQLNYVRKKFRKEQEHRFRTQYVTARVLEYEQVNRHVYGLPEDYLDMANEINRTNTDDENMTSKDEEENREKEKRLQTQGNSKPQQPPKPVNKTSPVRKGGQKTKTSPAKGDLKKKKEEEEAMAALAKARENQRGWYAQPDSDPVSPTADSGSHASHATSGYESEKLPSDHIDNTQPAEKGEQDAQHGHSKNNHLNHSNKNPMRDKKNDKQTVQKRLESQKSIYATENAAKSKPQARQQNQQQQIQKHKTNGNNNGKDSLHPTKQNEGKADAIADSHTKPVEVTSNTGAHVDNAKTQSLKDPDKKIFEKSATHPSSTTDSSSNPPVSMGSQAQTNKDTQSKTPSKHNANQSSDSSRHTQSTKQGHTPKEKGTDGPGFNSGNTSTLKPESQNNKNDTNKPDMDNKQSAKSYTHVKDNDKQNNVVNEGLDKNKRHPLVEDKQSKTNSTQPNQKANDKENASTKTQPGINTVQNSERQQPSSKLHTSDNASTSHPSTGAHPTQHPTSSITQKPFTTSSSNKTNPKGVSYKEPEELPHQLAHPAVSSTKTGPRKDSLSSNRTSQHPQSPPKKNTSSAIAKTQPSIVVGDDTRRKSRVESGKPDQDSRNQPKKKESVADRMFNIKTGPTWDPHRKTPKMEGIDTVVVTSKDKKGRDVKKRRDVTDVVKEADQLLKVNSGPKDRRGSSRQRHSRAVSPDLTLGSDFDVDEDDELEQDDIYERLRRKYNIAIDSDEED